MKKILLLSCGLIVAFLLFSNLFPTKIQEKQNILPTEASLTPTSSNAVNDPNQNDLEQYYKVYDNPFVKHIRVALDGYLEGTNKGVDDPETAITTSEVNGAKAGLASFDKSYYRSKFIVYSINDNIAGGKEINIIFQDKPDKIFWVWIYQIANSKYDLRGFAENNKFSSEEIDRIVLEYKTLIEDREHSI